MTAFIIIEQGDGSIAQSEVTSLLTKIDTSTDSVVTDVGNVVHQPLDDSPARLEAASA